MFNRSILEPFRSACCVLSLLLAFPLSAQDLSTIGQLARDGAPGLALKLLDEVQPDAHSNLQGWLFFERQRVEIMRGWKQWDALAMRLQTPPPNVPAEFVEWSQLEMANALLQSKQAAAARAALRQLMWYSPQKPLNSQLALYRRLIVRSYLLDNNMQDAQRAILRYQQDYGDKGEAWRIIRARVLLRTGQPQEAAALLADHTQAEALALRLLGQLRGNLRTAESVLGDVRHAVKDKQLDDTARARFWRVGAEAAEKMGSRLTQIRALEQVLHLAAAVPEDDNLFSLSGDPVWAAYEQYGKDEGNRQHLLIGENQRWLNAADEIEGENAELARALYTIVMFYGNDDALREQAYEKFTASMLKHQNGMTLVRLLFLHTQRFAKPSAIAAGVRYLLVDDALKSNDIETATRLMGDLKTAPQNTDAFEWALRRARVLILGGRQTAGIEVLNELLDLETELQDQDLDRVLQVIFDLQTVDQHTQALSLFERLRKRPLKPQAHRELLFWMADSYRALGSLTKAAAYYLQSATLNDSFGYDPWGQTARFRAAEVLSEAGLTADARRIYEGLMRITQAPERRAMLKYKLQELWLK